MDCDHHYRKRIYYQWFPPDCSREWNCNCGELLGQVQNRFSDDHDYSLLADLGGVFDVLAQIFIWLSVALTIISLITYIWQNKKVLSMQD